MDQLDRIERDIRDVRERVVAIETTLKLERVTVLDVDQRMRALETAKNRAIGIAIGVSLLGGAGGTIVAKMLGA